MTATPLHIRWMVPRDFTLVVEIENQSFDSPWSREDFAKALRDKTIIGFVAEDRNDREIFGFILYQIHLDEIEILNMAVRPDSRREGIGSMLLGKLHYKVCSLRKERATTIVRDSTLPLQQFLRANGWVAVGVLRRFYSDMGEDGYRFQYVPTQAERDVVFAPSASRR